MLGFAQDDLVEPIERFGRNGKHAAKFMGDPLPDSFYKTSPLKAMISTRHYRSTLELTTQLFDSESGDATLVLYNDDDLATSFVVVTAMNDSGTVFQKFVVPVEPEDHRLLDMSILSKYQNLYLHSGDNFGGYLEWNGGNRSLLSRDLKVEPASHEEAGNRLSGWCYEPFVRRSMNIQGDSYVWRPWFWREAVGGYTPEQYGLWVYWPDSVTPLHYPDNMSVDGNCETNSGYYRTVRHNKDIRWYDMEPVLFTPTGDTATAVCTSACGGDDNIYLIKNIYF